ncbi:MAG TPA: phosphoserine phosphatase SerB [Stellaceae bacterium]|jgi:phosphoserine phosphatase|nr:phosphoserine phosphatase SerB [Stellaceae bacterium]
MGCLARSEATKQSRCPEEARVLNIVVTLIAAPGEAALSAIVAALPAQLDWLAPETACDLYFEGLDATATETLARQVIGDAPIDLLVQPAGARRKRLLAADLESTIIENEMLDELAEFIGKRAEVSEITRRAMNGELDFEQALAARVALLKGLPASVLDEAAARIRLMPGARELVATMRASGARTLLVSGGFSVFAEPIAAQLGFDCVVCNRLDIAHGKIAGTVAPPIVTRETKRDALVALANESSIALADTAAIGDGANDLPMLHAAGLGIAFHAKPAVAAAARCRLDHADLTGVLYAQGYRREEIVAG